MVFDDSETVESEDAFWANALFNKQKEQTDSMRRELLACNESDPFSVKNTMQRILVMRIYHQITRLIRYTEQMDKIEQKLYQVIDVTLDNMDAGFIEENASSCLSMLMTMQQKIQQSMIDSQKLLDPYLNMDTLSYMELPVEQTSDDNEVNGHILDQDSRQKIRQGAQAALKAIENETGIKEKQTA